MTSTDAVPIWRTHLPRPVRRQTHLDVAQILKSGRMTGGPLTERLEQSLAAAFGRHAVAVSSGMDALELLLEAAEAQGRDVLIPANCFPSIPALADLLGARPHPVPVDPVHLAMTEEVADVAATALRPIAVWIHHAGMVAPHAQRTITRLREAGCTVIEDCAYLLPDDHPDNGPGTWGDMALFSYAPTKPLSGNGGAIALLRHAEHAEQVAGRRSHSGQEQRWLDGDAFHRGRTLTEFDASVAYWQWQHRAETRSSLRSLARAYTSHFTASGCPALPAGRTPQDTWGRFTVDLGAPAIAWQAREHMEKNGIATTQMFELPWSGYRALPGAKALQSDLIPLLQRTVCIPYHPTLPISDAHRVAEFVIDALTQKGHR
ncbi:DegT/DnrJ/EryC1/StrS family aminotransferase [Streptomyces sp. NBC_00140]|uniref:DegT/DnrJ/EryC1/StrS family aminotransferase n=1 Tax=Streptomyces sp. NBC_00140 TaxID=2975664 RepID=UPI00225753E0|nr:DegT/DnrJ/EryC1/StrS family aminotransferase [Streptomyces sp. NBC_00140]MCX5328138.1 DegT/DnrJ/EryC1/StrS family aminotransferase [Streptomyces sp. NBC_00140]